MLEEKRHTCDANYSQSKTITIAMYDNTEFCNEAVALNQAKLCIYVRHVEMDHIENYH